MRIGALAEKLVERMAVALNLAPMPLVDTQVAFNAARAIMAGSTLGVFDALAHGPRTASEVAQACATDPRATGKLLGALVSVGYLRYAGGRFANRRVATKWLVRSSPHSLHDKLAFQQLEWEWMAGLEQYVRTGIALDFHATMTPEQWASYQGGMRALSFSVAPVVAKSLPVPPGATTMLDIGGSHGLYSAALCRRHPRLRSTILELPGAMECASAWVARERLGDRVRCQAGDALSDDLGERAYDIVHISNVVHHFTDEQNSSLARRVRRALKPGGIYVIGEFDRRDEPGSGGEVAATCDLYFAMTSTSGTWSIDEIRGWQGAAGLQVGAAIRYTVLPGYVSQVARRAGAEELDERSG